MDKQKGSAFSRQAVIQPSSLADPTFTFGTVDGPLHRPRPVFRDLADLRSCSGVMAEMKSGDAQGGGGAPPRNAGPGRRGAAFGVRHGQGGEGPLPPTIGPMGGGVRRTGVPQMRRLCQGCGDPHEGGGRGPPPVAGNPREEKGFLRCLGAASSQGGGGEDAASSVPQGGGGPERVFLTSRPRRLHGPGDRSSRG